MQIIAKEPKVEESVEEDMMIDCVDGRKEVKEDQSGRQFGWSSHAKFSYMASIASLVSVECDVLNQDLWGSRSLFSEPKLIWLNTVCSKTLERKEKRGL